MKCQAQEEAARNHSEASRVPKKNAIGSGRNGKLLIFYMDVMRCSQMEGKCMKRKSEILDGAKCFTLE